MALFYTDNALYRANVNATILAIGDSWFWYPFPGGNLLNRIDVLTSPQGHNIIAKGNNGAEAFDYVHGVYESQVNQALKLYGKDLKAVFISGGGNDFAGFNDMRPLLKDDCSAATTAAACFKTGPGGLAQFLESVDASYRTLIGRIYTHTSPSCLILMHAYDYAVPDGRSVFAKGQGWLRPALVDAGVPDGLQQSCVVYLIDRFYATLRSICAMDPSHLKIVDSRGVLEHSDWANELHPKSKGFGKHVDQCWAPVLRKNNLA